MHLRTYLLAVQLGSLLAPGYCQRRGGGGGGDDGGGGDSDHETPGSTNPGRDRESAKFHWQPDCGGLGMSDTCACHLYPRRIQLYSLPGLYYNGTLTVTHRLSDNGAWFYEDLPEGRSLAVRFKNETCGSADRETKTYEYPAIFHAGPRGNDEDSNPLHWSLKAYQSGEETLAHQGPYIDIHQRFVHLRSSDFYIDRPFRVFDYWDEINANTPTNPYQRTRDRETNAYWTTEVTRESDSGGGGGGVYSAKTVYDSQAPNNTDSRRNLYPRSQYITLSDVCKLGFISTAEGTTKRFEIRDEGLTTEEETEAIVFNSTTTPAVWLPTGTEARIGGIGSDKLTFELSSDWGNETVVPWYGMRRARCDGSDLSTRRLWEQELETANAAALRREGSTFVDFREVMWNLTLSVEIKFEGSLVRENSTNITGLESGVLQFGKDYDWEEMEGELGLPFSRRPGSDGGEDHDDEEDSRGGRVKGVGWMGLVSLVVGVVSFGAAVMR